MIISSVAIQGQMQDFTFSFAVDHQVVEGISSGVEHLSRNLVVNVKSLFGGICFIFKQILFYLGYFKFKRVILTIH